MKRGFKACLAGIALAGVALGSGCTVYETGPVPRPVAAGYAYWYYPDVQVYYYPTTHVYWWFEGGTWASGPRPPRTVVLRESSRVSLNLPSDRPWSEHETVIKQHPPGRARGWQK